jgi:hypothetical protein
MKPRQQKQTPADELAVSPRRPTRGGILLRFFMHFFDVGDGLGGLGAMYLFRAATGPSRPRWPPARRYSRFLQRTNHERIPSGLVTQVIRHVGRDRACGTRQHDGASGVLHARARRSFRLRKRCRIWSPVWSTSSGARSAAAAARIRPDDGPSAVSAAADARSSGNVFRRCA